MMISKKIGLGKIKWLQTAHIHIYPPAAVFIEQFVSEDVRKTGYTSLAMTVFICVFVAEDPGLRDDQGSVAYFYSSGERREQRFIGPQSESMAHPEKGTYCEQFNFTQFVPYP